jgi:hypothetical protein
MYLARKETGPRQFVYVLRESYRSGDIFYSREIAELGRDPGRFFVYSDESSFHINEHFLRRLGEQGVAFSYGELEELLFPFLDPYLKNKLQPFRNRHKYRNWQRADEALLHRALTETHAVDRRRIHFLRMGRTSPETVEKTSALYTILLDKSRDEIEQIMLEREQALPPREHQTYLFTVFDLQRFFKESYARSIPQALNREQLDALFVEEICRLAADRNFWQGFGQTGRLPYPLVRYLIMYFDAAPEEPVNWSGFTRSRRSRRFHRSSPHAERMSRVEAIAILGLNGEQLASMRKKDLTRIYRQKAHELHPDKGGDTEQFIRLTLAYEELLPSLR